MVFFSSESWEKLPKLERRNKSNIGVTLSKVIEELIFGNFSVFLALWLEIWTRVEHWVAFILFSRRALIGHAHVCNSICWERSATRASNRSWMKDFPTWSHMVGPNTVPICQTMDGLALCNACKVKLANFGRNFECIYF